MDMHDTSTDMALSETEKPQTGGGHLGFGLGQLESAARHRTTSMPLAKPKPNDKDNHIRTGTPGVKFTNIQESIRTNAPHPQGVIAPCHLSSTSTGSMQLDVDVDDSVFGTSAMTNVDGDIGAGAGLEPEGAQRRRRSVSETLGGRGVSAWNGRSHERSVKKKKSTSVLMTGQRRLGSASYSLVMLDGVYSQRVPRMYGYMRRVRVCCRSDGWRWMRFCFSPLILINDVIPRAGEGATTTPFRVKVRLDFHFGCLLKATRFW